jgi:hypothetical protein
MCRRRWNVSIRERRRVGVTDVHLLSEEQMLKLVTWLGDSARFLWDELVASAIGDKQQEHMLGVLRRESHFDHRTAVVIEVLRGLNLQERQRCELELPVERACMIPIRSSPEVRRMTVEDAEAIERDEHPKAAFAEQHAHPGAKSKQVAARLRAKC